MHKNAERPFEERRKRGRAWEWAVLWWLILGKKLPALPLFDWPAEVEKGPRLYAPGNQGAQERLLPDIAFWRRRQSEFADVKSGKGFCWSREQEWQVSVDVAQCEQYQDMPCPMWIFLVAEKAHASPSDLTKGSPVDCPRGLYGFRIVDLRLWKAMKTTHEYAGEIYIPERVLTQLASYEEIQGYIPEHQKSEAHG